VRFSRGARPVLHDRRAVAQGIRADRTRARFARLCRARLKGELYFASAADALRLALAPQSFIESECEWLKHYEGGNMSEEQQYAAMIAEAESKGACAGGLVWARKFSTLKEALADTDAAMWAYHYAREVIKGRFEAGEAAIARDAACAYLYARDVIKGRFEAGEAAIAGDAWWAYRYAHDVIKGRFEAGEAAIAGDAWWAYHYARDVLKEGETLKV